MKPNDWMALFSFVGVLAFMLFVGILMYKSEKEHQAWMKKHDEDHNEWMRNHNRGLCKKCSREFKIVDGLE